MKLTTFRKYLNKVNIFTFQRNFIATRNSKHIIALIALIILLILTPIFLTLLKPQTITAAWFDDSWLYRKAVNLTNSSGSNLTAFQVSFTLDTATLISNGKMQSDCDDIRVTDTNGNLLPHWIEENNPGCNASATKIWTKVPSLPTSGATVYVYYGNSSAENVENGSNTFNFFEDFNGESLSSQWTNNTTNSTHSGGVFRINVGAARLTNALSFNLNDGYVLEGKVIYYETASNYSGTLTGVSSATYTQGSNAGADATVLYMKEMGSAGVYRWIGNGAIA